jgi:hypothetical protein
MTFVPVDENILEMIQPRTNNLLTVNLQKFIKLLQLLPTT